MSVAYNTESYFSEYQPTEIPYETYAIHNIVQRQQQTSRHGVSPRRPCPSFFRVSQISGNSVMDTTPVQSMTRPPAPVVVPAVHFADYRAELATIYPQLRDAGRAQADAPCCEPDDEIVQLKRYEACIALLTARRAIRAAAAAVARLCKQDRRALRLMLKEVECETKALCK